MRPPVRDAAYRDLPPCPTCGADRGDPCRTPSDRTTRPHAAREGEHLDEIVEAGARFVEELGAGR